MLRTNTVFCCHRNEIIAQLKEDFRYETHLPLTGPIHLESPDPHLLYLAKPDTQLYTYTPANTRCAAIFTLTTQIRIHTYTCKKQICGQTYLNLGL